MVCKKGPTSPKFETIGLLVKIVKRTFSNSYISTISELFLEENKLPREEILIIFCLQLKNHGINPCVALYARA